MSGGSSEQMFAGKYRLIAELGRGGMAEVHLSVASGPAGFNKLVVIKQLRQNLVDDPEFMTMFLDEARLAARLNHPNVVHTYEVVADKDQHFIAMEYLDGQPLHRIIRQLGRKDGLPLGMSLRILADVLAGLQYAHDLADYDGTPLNVVHRDVTPQNIFVTYEGQTKVVDFGIAKAMNSSSETRTGVIKGKIAYMSPEQSRSEHVDRRTDVFAAGVMLWEAATGQRLWKGLADVTILQRLMTNTPMPSPRSVNPEVPEALDAICVKALAAIREDRHASALELQNDIENFMMDNRLRVSGRDVGQFIAEKFATERGEIRTVIEAQLRASTEEASRVGKLPVLAPASSSPSVTIERTAAGIGGPASDRDSLIPPASTSPTLQTATPTIVSLGEKKAPPRIAQFGLVVGSTAVLILAGWMVMNRGAAAARSAAAAPSAPVAEAPQGRLALNLKASPPEAQFFLDDERLDGNPYAGIRPKDAASHALRVVAPGFATKTKTISFDSDISLDIELDKMAVAPGASAAASADKKNADKTAKVDSGRGSSSGGGKVEPKEPAKTEPVKTADPTPPPPKKGANVRLDTDDPWKK